MDETIARTTPTAFIWRRVHSLTGLWLVIYLFEHLLVNSQAALWIGDDGHGFIRLVNALESLPYLQVIEIFLIGFPLLVHGIWGVKRALTAKTNSGSSNGSKAALHLKRNRAFTWQRLTSWVLLFGIIAHVVQMRFLDFPKKASLNGEELSMVKITFDEGLYTLTQRLNVVLYSPAEITDMTGIRQKRSSLKALPIQEMSLLESMRSTVYEPRKLEMLENIQNAEEESAWLKKLSSFRLSESQVVAVAGHPGSAMLLAVRDTFKNPMMALLYTIFVLAAAFHAFNGFWTFLITWGVILSFPAQKIMAKVSWVGMALLAFFGLAAIWGSYWINLRY